MGPWLFAYVIYLNSIGKVTLLIRFNQKEKQSHPPNQPILQLLKVVDYDQLIQKSRKQLKLWLSYHT